MKARELFCKGVEFRDIPVDDAANWTQLLHYYGEQMDGFNGIHSTAGVLLAKFGEGRNCIRNFFADKVEVEYPNIWIMQEVSAGAPIIFDIMSPDRQKHGTAITKKFLEEASFFNPATTVPVGDAEAVAVRAPLRDFFFLAGIEETHHAVYRQLFPDQEDADIRESIETIAEYDALEMEWQALNFGIKFAYDRGITSPVINQYVERANNAGAVRQRQGLSVIHIPFLNL